MSCSGFRGALQRREFKRLVKSFSKELNELERLDMILSVIDKLDGGKA